MNTINQFYTRQKANDGLKLQLSLPDGTPTKEFIEIYGVDSDVFRKADAKSKQMLIKALNENKELNTEEAFETQRIELLSSLVKSWSFETPCTPEAVGTFLKEAPQIADQIDKVASDRKRFFANGLSSYTNEPKPSSD